MFGFPTSLPAAAHNHWHLLWVQAASSPSPAPGVSSSIAGGIDSFVTISDTGDFVAGCTKLFFAGWNQCDNRCHLPILWELALRERLQLCTRALPAGLRCSV